MAKGFKTGGRKKGTPNKKTDLFGICQERGIDVWEELLSGAAAEKDPDKRFNKFKELAPYLYAKKKESTITYTPEQLLDMAEQELNGQLAEAQNTPSKTQ